MVRSGVLFAMGEWESGLVARRGGHPTAVFVWSFLRKGRRHEGKSADIGEKAEGVGLTFSTAIRPLPAIG